MNKFSRKNIKNKKGGDCSYTRLQMNKAKSVLGPNGLESQVRKELVNSLSGIHKFLEGDLRKNIQHLQQIFNSNTVRKGDILNIINELDQQLKEVEQRNQSCYDELIIDPRGNDFGTKTSEASILEQYGENPDEYAKAQVNYIEHLLDDHPIVGIIRPTNDEEANIAVDKILEEEEEEKDQSTIPAWQKIDKKKDAANKIFTFKGDNQKYNFVEIKSNLGNYLRKSKSSSDEPRHKELRDLHNKLVQEHSSFEESSFQTDIIDKFELHNELANKTRRGGRKSRRTNKTRKYRSRRQ